MIKLLSDEAIKKVIIGLGFNELWTSNIEIANATAQEAQRDTLRQVMEWGEEVCPHWQGEQPGWKFTCIICLKELKKLAEEVNNKTTDDEKNTRDS